MPRVWTDEERDEMSKKQLGHKGYWTGKTRSEETKRKIGESHKGRKCSSATKDKMSSAKMGSKNPRAHAVVMYGMDGTRIAEFQSIADAARIMELVASDISLCVRNKKTNVEGYVFKYRDI